MPKQIAQYTQYHSLANLSADGTQAISLMSEKSKNSRFWGVMVWDVATGGEIKRYNNELTASVMALSPDGHHALIVERQETKREGMLGSEAGEYVIKNTITLWNIEQNRTKTHTLPEEANLYTGIVDTLWLDNSYCLILSRDNLILWDTSFENNGGQITTFQIEGGGGHHLLYDGETIILCRLNTSNNQAQDTLFFIKPHTWEMTRDKEVLQQALYQYSNPKPTPCIALSPNKQHFALLLQNQKTLAIKSLNSPIITKTLETDKKVVAFAWSSDSTKLFSAEQDGKEVAKNTRKTRLWVWDITTSEKTLIAELDYDYESTYGEDKQQKAWAVRELNNLCCYGDSIYINIGRKILVWEV